MPRIIPAPPRRAGRPKIEQPNVERPGPAPKHGGRPILLYVHFPFCRSKCIHCGFHSQAYNQITLAWYLKLLLEEIRLWGSRLQSPRVKTLYFGGGTPSLLTPGQLHQVIAALHDHFRLEPGLETTLEVNPDSGLDVGWYRALLSMGVNRLSIGMQSFEDADLAFLGRPHNAQQAVEAYELARRAGFANISLDLIWGLPGQRLKTWLGQLDRVTGLGPEHVSCYGLTIEPDTPLETLVAEGLALPGEQEQAKMFVYGAEHLESLGYLQYEISNFARMGFSGQHNLGYWDGADYLGLGPSAVSTLGDRRFANPKYMDEHDAAVRAGYVGEEFERIDPATRLREMIMLQLRTTRGLDLKQHAKLAGFDLTRAFPELLKTLRAKGLIRLNRGRLALTKPGMAVSNVIIERLAMTEPPAAPVIASGPQAG